MFEDAIEESARIIKRDGVKVGYVHVWSYAGLQNHRRLLDTLQEEPLRSADVLVWDIRGGWGGANPNYLNLFNQDVPVMTMVGRDGVRRDLDSQWRKPAVLLIDDGTRSGKEIIAYGFKKHGIGPVVGTKTAGAVVFGKPILLSNGAMLYLAVADVLVDGVRLEGKGVEPDIAVPFDVRYAGGSDPQLEKAVAVAAGLSARSTD
jgi:carboxyl-terminal processing protease